MLHTQEGKMWSDFHLVGHKIVKRLRRRQYDPAIIENLPFYSIALWLTKWCGLYSRTCLNLLREDKALIRVLSDFRSLDLNSLSDRRSITYSGGCFYIFLIYCFHHLKPQPDMHCDRSATSPRPDLQQSQRLQRSRN